MMGQKRLCAKMHGWPALATVARQSSRHKCSAHKPKASCAKRASQPPNPGKWCMTLRLCTLQDHVRLTALLAADLRRSGGFQQPKAGQAATKLSVAAPIS